MLNETTNSKNIQHRDTEEQRNIKKFSLNLCASVSLVVAVYELPITNYELPIINYEIILLEL